MTRIAARLYPELLLDQYVPGVKLSARCRVRMSRTCACVWTRVPRGRPATAPRAATGAAINEYRNRFTIRWSPPVHYRTDSPGTARHNRGMAFMFHRGLAIPLWGVVVSVVAVSTLPRVMPSVIALLGIAAAGYTMRGIARRLAASARPSMEVLPAADEAPARPTGVIVTAGTRTRTLREASDARAERAGETADLVRMDDDGGP